MNLKQINQLATTLKSIIKTIPTFNHHHTVMVNTVSVCLTIIVVVVIVV